MKIEKAERLIKNGEPLYDTTLVTIDGTEWTVPPDENNSMYQELKKQEREGKIVIAEKDVLSVDSTP